MYLQLKIDTISEVDDELRHICTLETSENKKACRVAGFPQTMGMK
jgi:hypothetical protein